MATTVALQSHFFIQNPCRTHKSQTHLTSSKPHRNANATVWTWKSRRLKRGEEKSPLTMGKKERLVILSPATKAARSLVMGEVRILKRGEPLVLSSPDTGLDTETEIDKVFKEAYTGSVTIISPSPSLVPYPSFLGAFQKFNNAVVS